MAHKYVEIPLEELTTPKQGYETIVDGWWLTLNGNPVNFMMYGTISYPQYNHDEELIKWRMKREPKHEFGCLFIPVAYIPKRN